MCVRGGWWCTSAAVLILPTTTTTRAGAGGGEEQRGGFLLFYVLLVVVVALSGAVFDVHYHSAHAKKLVCSATGVYAPKCHQNEKNGVSPRVPKL